MSAPFVQLFGSFVRLSRMAHYKLKNEAFIMRKICINKDYHHHHSHWAPALCYVRYEPSEVALMRVTSFGGDEAGTTLRMALELCSCLIDWCVCVLGCVLVCVCVLYCVSDLLETRAKTLFALPVKLWSCISMQCNENRYPHRTMVEVNARRTRRT